MNIRFSTLLLYCTKQRKIILAALRGIHNSKLIFILFNWDQWCHELKLQKLDIIYSKEWLKQPWSIGLLCHNQTINGWFWNKNYEEVTLFHLTNTFRKSFMASKLQILLYILSTQTAKNYTSHFTQASLRLPSAPVEAQTFLAPGAKLTLPPLSILPPIQPPLVRSEVKQTHQQFEVYNRGHQLVAWLVRKFRRWRKRMPCLY